MKGKKGGRKGGVQIYISKRVHIEERKEKRERMVQDRKEKGAREREVQV